MSTKASTFDITSVPHVDTVRVRRSNLRFALKLTAAEKKLVDEFLARRGPLKGGMSYFSAAVSKSRKRTAFHRMGTAKTAQEAVEAALEWIGEGPSAVDAQRCKRHFKELLWEAAVPLVPVVERLATLAAEQGMKAAADLEAEERAAHQGAGLDPEEFKVSDIVQGHIRAAAEARAVAEDAATHAGGPGFDPVASLTLLGISV